MEYCACMMSSCMLCVCVFVCLHVCECVWALIPAAPGDAIVVGLVAVAVARKAHTEPSEKWPARSASGVSICTFVLVQQELLY